MFCVLQHKTSMQTDLEHHVAQALEDVYETSGPKGAGQFCQLMH